MDRASDIPWLPSVKKDRNVQCVMKVFFACGNTLYTTLLEVVTCSRLLIVSV